MNWEQIKGLKESRAKAFADAAAIREIANKENRDLTADENTKHEKLLSDVESYKARIDREERAAAMDTFIADHKSNVSNVGREDNKLGIPARDLRKYSIHKAIRQSLAQLKGHGHLDGLEAEVNDEMEKRIGKKAQGFYMPTDIPMAKRTLNATSTGVGSIMTTTEATFIDFLRAKLVTDKLGATILTGLQGKIAIPQKTATSTAYWLADGGSPTGSNSTLGQVLFSPKTLGAYTDITRQFVEQTSLDAEEFTRDDLIRTLAVAIDTAAFVGTGANNQPTGIVNTSGVGNIAIGTNGGDPTYQTYVSLETTVANVNADLGQMSYVTTPAQRGYLKTLARSSSAVGVGFVWQDDNTINGYPAFASNILPNNGTKGTGTNLSTSVFGNFNDLVIAQWGGLDIIVDPYTGSSSGTVRIVALQDLDIELRHAASFAYCSDLASV